MSSYFRVRIFHVNSELMAEVRNVRLFNAEVKCDQVHSLGQLGSEHLVNLFIFEAHTLCNLPTLHGGSKFVVFHLTDNFDNCLFGDLLAGGGLSTADLLSPLNESLIHVFRVHFLAGLNSFGIWEWTLLHHVSLGVHELRFGDTTVYPEELVG